MHTAHRLHILHEGHPALLNDRSGLFTAGNDNSAKSEIFFVQLVSITHTLTSYWVLRNLLERRREGGEGERERGEEVGEMRHESEGRWEGERRGEEVISNFIVPDHPIFFWFVSCNYAWTSAISKLHTYCQFAVWKEGRMLIIMYTHVATPLNIRWKVT